MLVFTTVWKRPLIPQFAHRGILALLQSTNVRAKSCTSKEVYDVIEREGGSMSLNLFPIKFKQLYGRPPFTKRGAKKQLEALSAKDLFSLIPHGNTFYLTNVGRLKAEHVNKIINCKGGSISSVSEFIKLYQIYYGEDSTLREENLTKKLKRMANAGYFIFNDEDCSMTTCIAEQALLRCVAISDTVVDVPKENIDKLPLVTYKQRKQVVVISDAAASNAAVKEIRNTLSMMKGTGFRFVGFDTERKGENWSPSLVQLATSETAYLFRLRYEGKNTNDSVMTVSLKKLLADPSIIKVGIGALQDMKRLRFYSEDCVGDGRSYLDLKTIVRVCWPCINQNPSPGLRGLTAAALGMNLPKARGKGDWEIKELTERMIQYAADDAFVALDLLDALLGKKPQH